MSRRHRRTPADAEETVGETEANLNRAQAVAHVGSWHLDVRKDVLTWSDETYRIFGVPMGTPPTYRKFLDIVHPEDRSYVDRSWTATLKGEPYNIEHRIIVEGEVKWVSEMAEVDFDKQGRAVAGIGTIRDITKLKKAEEALQESEERYRTLVETSSECICNLDLDGNFLYMNPAGLRMYKMSESEVKGIHCTKLVKPAYRNQIKDTLEKAKKGESVNFQYEIEAPSESKWFESVLTPIKDDSGEVVSLLRISTDITERKKAEEKLKKRVDELEDLHRITVRRELKMIELEKEIERLKEDLIKEREND